ncbi:hypothetical protein D3C86_1319760 [compost metagenome]
MPRSVVPGLHLAALEFDLARPADALAASRLRVADRAHAALGLDGEDLAILDNKVVVAARGPGVSAPDFSPCATHVLQPDHVTRGSRRGQVPGEVAIGRAGLPLQQQRAWRACAARGHG